MSSSAYSYTLEDSKHGQVQGFATLEQARQALLAWILWQRQAGEPVNEHAAGQWSDSRVTRWIADAEGEVIPLESRRKQEGVT